MAENSWSLRDLSCVWHPFTQAFQTPPPIPIVRGKGSYLYTESETAYLDAISSWWVNLHGHAHPHIAKALAKQAETLEHVLFAGFTHPQAIFLAERLLSLLPQGYSRVFYSDNGSTSVEVAIKIAFQVSGKRKTLLSFEGGYHGDTFGAMAAAGKTHFNRPFWPYLFQVHSIPPPLPGKEETSWQAFEHSLSTYDLSAFLFEPIIQGSGGMHVHCKESLTKMIRACQAKGVITIADEVMTGFGRTGPLFACELLGASPDIICLSKGITGGFLPLGATIAKEFLFQAFLSPDPQKALLHGHSYTANPLACAAANASLDLLVTPECSQARSMIERAHQQFRTEYGIHPKIKRCDCLGTILVVEYQAGCSSYYHPLKKKLSDLFFQEQILIRPLGNTLYLLPPYSITHPELQKIYSTILLSLEALQ